MKQYSARYVRRVANITSLCFSEAIRESFNLEGVHKDTIDDIAATIRVAKAFGTQRSHGDLEITPQDIAIVDEMYLKLLCELPTKDLSQIIRVHNSQQIKRAPLTVEVILAELARRSLLGDSNESDLNEEHDESTEES